MHTGSVPTFGGIDLDDIIADAVVLDNQGNPYTHVAAYGYFIDGDAVGSHGAVS